MITITGFHGVREALRSHPDRVRKVVLAEGRLDRRAREIVELARSRGIPVYREKTRIVDQLASGAHHQGVAAELSGISWWPLEDLIAAAPAPALLVALDEVEDPRNFGAVVRAADGAGAHGIVVPKRRAAPPSDAAVAASAGALLHARLARVTNLTDALEKTKRRDIWTVGLSPSAETSWFDFDFTSPVLLVLGAEGRGLRPRVERACDQLICLPQLGQVESLNISVAAGIVLYEAVRQRLQKHLD
jgi:23S rRNA (guanosine2251-2'-O)-methyltransferase